MISEAKLEAVCGALRRGLSYRKACKRVGVDLRELRSLRYGDPAVMRRCAASRATGLCGRADALRYVARTKSVRNAAQLEARAKKYLREAERITRGH